MAIYSSLVCYIAHGRCYGGDGDPFRRQCKAYGQGRQCHYKRHYTIQPKATCARACHTPADSVDFAGHNYGSGDKYSTHVQGVLASGTDTTVYWEASQTKSFEHGISVGKHMNQGRNEDYTNTYRAQFGDPFFTSSPGMFGKY